MNKYMGLILTLIAGLFFLVGGLISLKVKNKDKLNHFSIALALIIILNLLIMDLIPEIFELLESYELGFKILLIVIFTILGILILKILDFFIPDHHHDHHDNEKNKKEHSNLNDTVETDIEGSIEDQIINDFKEKLLNAIAMMTPNKFEAFSRALLTKMGVEFTNQDIKISNDGGIDGYGYHKDLDDFKTTRVVIQCKWYNAGPVTEPDINQFLGAMNKFQADYGVFITNSRFTNSAKIASREGSPITLIDGNDLVEVVIRYQLYITPVTTYVLDDFYNE